jgi:hypothetical protein
MGCELAVGFENGTVCWTDGLPCIGADRCADVIPVEEKPIRTGQSERGRDKTDTNHFIGEIQHGK